MLSWGKPQKRLYDTARNNPESSLGRVPHRNYCLAAGHRCPPTPLTPEAGPGPCR